MKIERQKKQTHTHTNKIESVIPWLTDNMNQNPFPVNLIDYSFDYKSIERQFTFE